MFVALPPKNYIIHILVSLVPPPSSDEAAWWDGPGERTIAGIHLC